jgi:hypothetical protein
MPEDSVFIIFMLCLFLLLIIGTKLKWKILVDPPEEWRHIYSHSALKYWLGSDFLIGFNYMVGIAGSLISLYFLYTILIK